MRLKIMLLAGLGLVLWSRMVSASCFDDADSDGYPTCGGGSSGYYGPLDCNDADASVYPGATETCNGIDDNCNGYVDEGYVDADADGWGVGAGQTSAVCAGAVGTHTDCNDADASVYPGAPETCNGIDDNCDGGDDEGGVCETPTPTPATPIPEPATPTPDEPSTPTPEETSETEGGETTASTPVVDETPTSAPSTDPPANDEPEATPTKGDIELPPPLDNERNPSGCATSSSGAASASWLGLLVLLTSRRRRV